MTKPELIDAVARTTGMRKSVTSTTIDATFEAIMDALGRGEPVAIAGFGTFDVRGRAARIGRNPRTGEQISIAATTACAFRPGKRLKGAVTG